MMPGTLLVGQSGGGTAVINGSLAGVVAEAQQRGIARLLGMRHGVEGLLREHFVDLSRLDGATIEVLRQTPSGALGLCRYQPSASDIVQAIEVLRRWDVRWLLYIGGNDSAETAHRLAHAADDAGHRLTVVSVPKTIDNDLPCTDHTPGYGTAARFVAEAALFLQTDARAMRTVDQVRILEVYGRDTGWLAAAAALGTEAMTDVPQLILTPEHPFRSEPFLGAVDNSVRRCGYVTVVVGEMLKDDDGRLVGIDQPREADRFGNAESQHPGAYLEQLIRSSLALRAKNDRPGSLQKVTAWDYSNVDAEEAFAVGRAAVSAALEGATAHMVTLVRDGTANHYHCTTGLVRVTMVARATRPLPAAFFDAERHGVTSAFLDYARPLIGAPLPSLARLDRLPDAVRE